VKGLLRLYIATVAQIPIMECSWIRDYIRENLTSLYNGSSNLCSTKNIVSVKKLSSWISN